MERHNYLQLVLPLYGEIDLDISGHQAVIGGNTAAIVPIGYRHTQAKASPHQALILDIDASLAAECDMIERQENCYFQSNAQSKIVTRALARAASSGDAQAASLHHTLRLITVQSLTVTQALLALQEMVALSPLNALTVVDMAAVCGLKQSQFHEVFRAHFGMTPHQWLTKQKLDCVKLRLEQSDTSLSDLALLSGYSDQTALTRAFRNHFGVPLSEYRRISRH